MSPHGREFRRVRLGPFDVPLCELDGDSIWALVEADGRSEFWKQGMVVMIDGASHVVSGWTERQTRYKTSHPHIVDHHPGLDLVLAR